MMRVAGKIDRSTDAYNTHRRPVALLKSLKAMNLSREDDRCVRDVFGIFYLHPWPFQVFLSIPAGQYKSPSLVISLPPTFHTDIASCLLRPGPQLKSSLLTSNMNCAYFTVPIAIAVTKFQANINRIPSQDTPCCPEKCSENSNCKSCIGLVKTPWTLFLCEKSRRSEGERVADLSLLL